MNAKEKIIQEILENTVYTPESGVVKNLSKSLLKLSLSDLKNLELILSIKETDRVAVSALNYKINLRGINA